MTTLPTFVYYGKTRLTRIAVTLSHHTTILFKKECTLLKSFDVCSGKFWVVTSYVFDMLIIIFLSVVILKSFTDME